jgi:hypothetical protein
VYLNLDLEDCEQQTLEGVEGSGLHNAFRLIERAREEKVAVVVHWYARERDCGRAVWVCLLACFCLFVFLFVCCCLIVYFVLCCCCIFFVFFFHASFISHASVWPASLALPLS